MPSALSAIIKSWVVSLNCLDGLSQNQGRYSASQTRLPGSLERHDRTTVLLLSRCAWSYPPPSQASPVANAARTRFLVLAAGSTISGVNSSGVTPDGSKP